jgi:hypothetical protein
MSDNKESNKMTKEVRVKAYSRIPYIVTKNDIK